MFPSVHSLNKLVLVLCRFPRFSRPPLAGDLAEAISSLKALKSLM